MDQPITLTSINHTNSPPFQPGDQLWITVGEQTFTLVVSHVDVTALHWEHTLQQRDP